MKEGVFLNVFREVRVNGVPEPIWTAPVVSSWNLPVGRMPFILGECAESALIEVETETEVRSVRLRPKSKKIPVSIDRNRIRFTAKAGDKLSLELNGSSDTALGVFLSVPVPKPENTTVFFPAGIHDAGVLRLKTGDVLWLEKGAYVKGKLLLEGDDITVCGNGILSGEDCVTPEETYLVQTVACRNLRFSGITLMQSLLWNMRLMNLDDSEIHDLKIFGYRGNNDGIDVCGSRNVHVHDCFIRSTDDCLCVKGFNTGDVKNVLFERCVLWNDYANPMRIGGIRADRAEHLVFRDMDVIHNHAGYPAFAVLEGNRAHISDLQVSDLRIEDARNSHLFDIRIQRNLWNTDPHAGPMEHVSFRNVSLGDADTVPEYLPQESVIRGWSESCGIDDVTFENITLYGKQACSLSECRIDVRENVRGVRFLGGDDTERRVFASARLTAPVPEGGSYKGTLLLKAENRSAEPKTLTLRPRVAPGRGISDPAFDGKRFSLRPGETRAAEFPVRLTPGKFLFWVDSDDVLTRTEYDPVTLPFLLPAREEDARAYPIRDAAGAEGGRISLWRDGAGLFCRAVIRRETAGPETAKLRLFFCGKPALRDGDAVFSAPEAVEGRAPSLAFAGGKLVTEPIMRNYAEIQYTLTNAPRYDILTELSAEAGGKTRHRELTLDTVENGNGFQSVTRSVDLPEPPILRSVRPVEDGTEFLLTVPESMLPDAGAKPFLFEAEAIPVLRRGASKTRFTLNGSLDPELSVHMYGEISL